MGTILVSGEGSLEVRKAGFEQSLLPAAGQGALAAREAQSSCDGDSRKEWAGGLTEDVTFGLRR